MNSDPHSLDVVYELAVHRRFIDPAIVLELIAELRVSRKVVAAAARLIGANETSDYDYFVARRADVAVAIAELKALK